LIEKVVKGGCLGVNINGEESSYLKTGKGLRQQDPLSTLLLNLVGDVLTRMLDRAAEEGKIRSLLHNFRFEGIKLNSNLVSHEYA